jgi:DHA1 family tetracycline resistance protein-like MFS transporter
MPVKPKTNKALPFIFITILIDTMGLGIIIPVMPVLIQELTGEGLASAAIYGGWLLFVYALMQFFFAPVLGNLSDKFGRRPVLLLSLFVFSIDYFVMAYSQTIVWLFAARMVAGAAGATGATANAYIADITPEKDRAQNFGLIGAAWGLGFILGPVIGGFIGEYGTRMPFFAAVALALSNMVYGYFVLPETLSKENRRPFQMKRANPVGALLQLRQYPLVFSLLLVIFVLQVAHDANPSVWTYYTIEKFNWSPREIGYSLGFVGLLIAVIQGGLIRIVIPKIGERNSVYLGLTLMATGFAGIAVAVSGTMLYFFLLPFAMGGLAMPAVRSIMSSQIPANAQGELQGAISSTISFTAIISPLIMTGLFGYFSSSDSIIYFPGAPFLTAGILVIFGLMIFKHVTRHFIPPEPAIENEDAEN